MAIVSVGIDLAKNVFAVGARQGSSRLIHAANGCISCVSECIVTAESRLELKVTAPMGGRVFGDFVKSHENCVCAGARLTMLNALPTLHTTPQ